MHLRHRCRLVLFAIAVSLAGAGCVGPAPASLGRAQEALDICAVSPEGALCNDGKACTVNDRCMGGICVGMVAPDDTPCTDGDVCTINDVCTAGVCAGTMAPDNHPCTDGEPCTDPDTCHAGKCQPGPPKVCDDGNICTLDSCVVTKGCLFAPIPECTMPVDARDASQDPPVDQPPPPDVAGPEPPADVPPIDMPIDMSLPDGPDLRPLPDVMDVASDGVEASGDAVPEVADGPADGIDARKDAAPSDAGDTADGAEDTPGVPPDLRARGGACVCSAGDGPSGWGTLPLGLLLAAACVRRRRGRSGSLLPGKSA
jgi:MYXO-CTERM domain-containing protein